MTCHCDKKFAFGSNDFLERLYDGQFEYVEHEFNIRNAINGKVWLILLCKYTHFNTIMMENFGVCKYFCPLSVVAKAIRSALLDINIKKRINPVENRGQAKIGVRTN